MYKASHIVDSFILQMNKYSLIQQGKAACDVSPFRPKVTQQIGFEYSTKGYWSTEFTSSNGSHCAITRKVAHKALEAEDLWMMRAFTLIYRKFSR